MKNLSLILVILLLSACGSHHDSSQSDGVVESTISDNDNNEDIDNESTDESPYVDNDEEEGDEDEETLSDEERYFAQFSDFVQSSSDVRGAVVYEGSGSYYIIETNMGYTIAEWYGGAVPFEGQTIYGQLHSYGMKYFIVINNDREVKLWIEDYMLSRDRAIEWLGEHNHLKYSDQEQFDQLDDW